MVLLFSVAAKHGAYAPKGFLNKYTYLEYIAPSPCHTTDSCSMLTTFQISWYTIQETTLYRTPVAFKHVIKQVKWQMLKQ